MCKEWSEAKKVAYKRQGGLCFVCGEPLSGIIVGHHVHNKSKGGANTPDNCQLRHQEPCEQWSHQVHPTGNPTARQVAEFLQGEGYEKTVAVRNS